MTNSLLNIAGSRVVLRDLTDSDIQKFWNFHYLAEDREFLNWNGPYKPIEELPFEKWATRYQNDLTLVGTDEAREVLVIEIDGECRGTVGRYWVDKVTNWCEIGIVIYDSSYWSGGYGFEAFSLWIDYLFEKMDVVRLGIATWSGNERMINLAEKCGMSMEARIRKARIVRGEYYDSIKMGMLREEWEAKKLTI
ncbi:GNAT family N-acetyltransferase [Brevibacillus daliensis]|uniref:GNAT family N-acetyltransferase n=1 Tax=Brevibacillus daliensis TaxID=2892995 RepID=UPI001E3AC2C4|nr:GNAT family protein [Brevibacillus daliensis]